MIKRNCKKITNLNFNLKIINKKNKYKKTKLQYKRNFVFIIINWLINIVNL